MITPILIALGWLLAGFLLACALGRAVRLRDRQRPAAPVSRTHAPFRPVPLQHARRPLPIASRHNREAEAYERLPEWLNPLPAAPIVRCLRPCEPGTCACRTCQHSPHNT